MVFYYRQEGNEIDIIEAGLAGKIDDFAKKIPIDGENDYIYYLEFSYSLIADSFGNKIDLNQKESFFVLCKNYL